MLLIIGLLILCIYLFLRYVYSYWSRKGFPSLKPQIPYGNLKKVAKREISFGLSIYDLYLKSKEPFVGVYLFFRPALLIRDPELVKAILVENFSTFHDRGVYCNEERDPLSATLFALPGAKWKSLRTQLTPTFSSGKMKGMFPTILDVGKKLDVYMDKFAQNNGIVNVKDDFSQFTVAIIASVIFGLEVDTIGDSKHPFSYMAKRLNSPNFLQTLKLAASFLCPKVLEFFKIKWLPDPVENFMVKIVKNTIEHRENNDITRKDFMQLLLQLRNTGEIKDDDNWNVKPTSDSKKTLSIEQLAAQVFIFYIAGFDTSSSTMSYCLYELAQNPDIMKRLQIEIDSTLEKHDGKITYDGVQEMKYLECCLNETLRKYPSLPILNRECNKDYQIPNSEFIIEKGIGVVISVFGIHRDPLLYPNPEEFDPERFSDENKAHNMKFFFPFGDGPRNCIGFRLGKLIAKIGLITMLAKYNFEALDNKKLEFDVAPVTLIAKGGINLRISKRHL